MKNKLTIPTSRALARLIRPAFTAALLPVLLLLLTIQSSHAGSATWLASPGSNNWNTASNWTPATVPNSPSDTATFATSNQTEISAPTFFEINSIVFNAGASAFTIRPENEIDISGVGITNNAGVTENFVNDVYPSGGLLNGSTIIFLNGASAGSSTSFVNNGGAIPFSLSTAVIFQGTSNAGSGVFTNNGSPVSDGSGGGGVSFYGGSTASNATITNNGGTGSAYGGATGFFESSTAGAATLIANAGLSGGYGGYIVFDIDSTGGTARVELFGNATGDLTNGTLSIQTHNSPGVTIGSLEGSGVVLLGANKLTVGSNNLSTVFSGRIQDGSFASGGSLTKIGKGKLTLSKASTYTGGTTISKGALLVTNKTGSATGTGAVVVSGGTLGGTGKMSGAVTIATATRPAILAPGVGARPGTLTTASALTFNSLATYKVDLNSSTVTADQVVANGVTINSGAQISIDDLGSSVLTAGTVFTIINNTAAIPIAGAFSNLADGSTLTVGSNNYQVSYEGDTGNDLTLTVAP